MSVWYCCQTGLTICSCIPHLRGLAVCPIHVGICTALNPFSIGLEIFRSALRSFCMLHARLKYALHSSTAISSAATSSSLDSYTGRTCPIVTFQSRQVSFETGNRTNMVFLKCVHDSARMRACTIPAQKNTCEQLVVVEHLVHLPVWENYVPPKSVKHRFRCLQTKGKWQY
jgi:hypothetical protein